MNSEPKLFVAKLFAMNYSLRWGGVIERQMIIEMITKIISDISTTKIIANRSVKQFFKLIEPLYTGYVIRDETVKIITKMIYNLLKTKQPYLLLESENEHYFVDYHDMVRSTTYIECSKNMTLLIANSQLQRPGSITFDEDIDESGSEDDF